MNRVAIVLGAIVFLGFAGSARAQSDNICSEIVFAPGDIQGTIDAAMPGDTICLSGTHNVEFLFIIPDQKALTLRSLPGETATLDGGGGGALIVVADNVTIRDLDFRNFSIAIFAVATKNLSVLDNSFSNVIEAVLGDSTLLGPNQGMTVDGNSVAAAAFGLGFQDCDTCKIKSNYLSTLNQSIEVQTHGQSAGISIQDNFVAGAPGIIVTTSAGDELFGTLISGNRLEVLTRGIVLISRGDMRETQLIKNEFVCTSTGDSTTAVDLAPQEDGVLTGTKFILNEFAGCDTEIDDRPGSDRIILPPSMDGEIQTLRDLTTSRLAQ